MVYFIYNFYTEINVHYAAYQLLENRKETIC